MEILTPTFKKTYPPLLKDVFYSILEPKIKD